MTCHELQIEHLSERYIQKILDDSVYPTKIPSVALGYSLEPAGLASSSI
jgi:hypothetical protein